MTLPKQFGDLSVLQYQECDRILKDKNEDEFLGSLTAPVRLIAYLSGKTEEQVLSMDIEKEYAKLSFLNHPEQLDEFPARALLVANKKVYKADLKTPEMKTGAILGLKYFESQKNPVKYLHDQLATIYLPVNLLGITRKYDATKHKKIADDLRHAKLKDVYGYLVFKKKVFETLSPIMEISLKNASKTIQEILPEVMAWARQEGLTVS